MTGQTVYTIEMFRPLRNLWNKIQNYPRTAITVPGLSWISNNIYRYHRTMLMNLSPREPATLHWPMYSFPPPHFLVGYQYVVKTCNDYVFDNRVFSRVRYSETVAPMQHYINWSVMANCSYTINTGAYHRFVDIENFAETLAQVQQAILAERVAADLALLRPTLRGFGTATVGRENNVPVARLMQSFYKDIGQCQERAWGLADKSRIENAGPKDLAVLTAIRRLKTAYCHFMTASKSQHTFLSLPCDYGSWLSAFVDKFSDPTNGEFQQRLRELPTQTLTKCIIDALSLPQESGVCPGLSGGAFELRPRENGRAVTQEMRRRRGEVVERFIESLPMRRRRRRRRPSEAPPAEVMEVEEEEEEPPTTFEDEVRQTVAEAIRQLEEELTETARNQQFFNFAVDFYRVIQRLELMGDINENTLRRWVMYFFVTEHIATTFNYLHHALRLNRRFARTVELTMGQLVMRGRDSAGNVLFNRVWYETGVGAFGAIMRRVSTDLAATVERAGHGELDEDEVDQLMTDIAYHDNSGDVQEILRQAQINDTEVDSIELSFRFKVSGPVIITQNRNIITLCRRVIATATQMRSRGLPLPALNDQVQLLPDQRPQE
ncbi:terminal protein pTP [Gould's wattled bat adenovirus 1]|nr:terminal protein pTP [Mastadenovirus sp.]